MSHFAEIDDQNLVVRVIVAEQDFINSGAVGDPHRWIQTSYNTHGGEHLFGGTPLRKNYAAVGYHYDPVLDAFVPPKPHDSWLLDQDTGLWTAPIPRPIGTGQYLWNEQDQSWIEIENVILPSNGN